MKRNYRYDQHGWTGGVGHKQYPLYDSENWFTLLMDFTFRAFLWLVATGIIGTLGWMFWKAFLQ